jgi:hypothetical protein
MKNVIPGSIQRRLPKWLSAIPGLQYIGILFNTWDQGNKLLSRLLNEGIYEVLEYESTLELKDKSGKEATFRKRERVRYLQDNIIAYQDQAWGDGEILLNYKCSPGYPVDQYRPGHKTYILISLREIKNRGDLDEFNIKWSIRNGFLRKTELWETTVCHPTKHLKINIIFPKNRPPLNVTLNDGTHQKNQILDKNYQNQLPDGRWLVSWGIKRPQKNKEYILKWSW